MNKYNGTDFEDLANIYNQDKNNVVNEKIENTKPVKVIVDNNPSNGFDFEKLNAVYSESSDMNDDPMDEYGNYEDDRISDRNIDQKRKEKIINLFKKLEKHPDQLQQSYVLKSLKKNKFTKNVVNSIDELVTDDGKKSREYRELIDYIYQYGKSNFLNENYDEEQGDIPCEQDTDPDEYEDEDIVEEKTKKRTFNTYSAWKKAVKKLDNGAKFTGDKDIDGSFKKGSYDAEWDGEQGKIIINEGFMDRMKARGSAAMDAAKDYGGNIAKAGRNIGRTISGDRKSTFETGKNVANRYLDKKAYNIVSTHVQRIEQRLSDLATDLVKLGVANEETAEKIAQDSFAAIKGNQEIRSLIGRKAL